MGCEEGEVPREEVREAELGLEGVGLAKSMRGRFGREGLSACGEGGHGGTEGEGKGEFSVRGPVVYSPLSVHAAVAAVSRDKRGGGAERSTEWEVVGGSRSLLVWGTVAELSGTN